MTTPHHSTTEPRERGALVTCPVCKMEMDPAHATSTREHAGVTYHFCAIACERAFLREPTRYVAAADQIEAAAGDALALVPYPVFLVGTTAATGSAHFMLANWGTQASFEPWRFVVAVTRTARTLANAERAGAFTVNLLDASAKAVPRAILRAKGADQLHARGPTEAPRLAASYAGFDCRLTQVVDVGGDHVLLVGEVVGGWKSSDELALRLSELGMSYAG